jgi:glycosyltransferase involved in cell wall biosynthesis
MDPAAKGQDLLLRALARPEWRERPVVLNCFGAGPDELALRRMAGMLQLNNIHFRGHVTDVRAIREQNHLLVLPSRYEGLPLVLVEAMWCAGIGCNSARQPEPEPKTRYRKIRLRCSANG